MKLINNLRQADDTVLIAEREEDLQSLLYILWLKVMRVDCL